MIMAVEMAWFVNKHSASVLNQAHPFSIYDIISAAIQAMCYNIVTDKGKLTEMDCVLCAVSEIYSEWLAEEYSYYYNLRDAEMLGWQAYDHLQSIIRNAGVIINENQHLQILGWQATDILMLKLVDDYYVNY